MKKRYEPPMITKPGTTNLLSIEAATQQRVRYLIRMLDRKADLVLRDDRDPPQAPDERVA